MTDDAALIAQLRRHEGWRARPYRDSVGKLTIGCGRNLDDVGLSDDEIALLLSNDIARTRAGLDTHLPWWRSLSEARQRVLADMGFNLGIGRLMEFRLMLDAVQRGDFAAAASQMLASRWAGQVGDRATELAKVMRTG
jgi:lysozyme